eukprot:CAMPEP_0184484574 /NCGR_PEP_ID=MMETSP0113_2-20130426/6280_1 /TAXON_ID=91329 /ORGANISM="Norrisiella sphaerica, Strain BC52" /LENGTH=1167 /DNA_ID=CAMNT_0026865619 /DNA_START=260 /DNA_END=3763 /DNA_ORIENTATION=+
MQASAIPPCRVIVQKAAGRLRQYSSLRRSKERKAQFTALCIQSWARVNAKALGMWVPHAQPYSRFSTRANLGMRRARTPSKLHAFSQAGEGSGLQDFEQKLSEFSAFVREAPVPDKPRAKQKADPNGTAAANPNVFLQQARQIRDLLLLLNQVISGGRGGSRLKQEKNGSSATQKDADPGVLNRAQQVHNTYLEACAKVQDFHALKMAINAMEKPDSVSYLHIMEAYAAAGDAKGAEEAYRMASKAGRVADSAKACNMVLQAYLRAQDGEGVNKWLRKAGNMSVQLDFETFNLLLARCARIGASEQAERWMVRMQAEMSAPGPGFQAYRSLILTHLKAGKLEKAEKVIQELAEEKTGDAAVLTPDSQSLEADKLPLHERIEKDPVIRAKFIESFADHKQPDRLNKAEDALLDLVRSSESLPPPRVFAAVVHAAVKTKDIARVERLLAMVQTIEKDGGQEDKKNSDAKQGYILGEGVYVSVLRMFWEAGESERAQKLVQELDEAGRLSERLLKTAIELSAPIGQWEVSRAYLEKIRARDSMYPCGKTYKFVLMACEKAGACEEAADILNEMQQTGIPAEATHLSFVHRAYIRAQRPDDAEEWAESVRALKQEEDDHRGFSSPDRAKRNNNNENNKNNNVDKKYNNSKDRNNKAAKQRVARGAREMTVAEMNTELVLMALRGDRKGVALIRANLRGLGLSPSPHAYTCLIRGAPTVYEAERLLRSVERERVALEAAMVEEVVLKLHNTGGMNEAKRAVRYFNRLVRKGGELTEGLLLAILPVFASLKDLRELHRTVSRLGALRNGTFTPMHYQAIIWAYTQAGSLSSSLSWHTKMYESGWRLPISDGDGCRCSYHALISLAVQRGDKRSLQAWVAEMKTHWITPSPDIVLSIATFYASPKPDVSRAFALPLPVSQRDAVDPISKTKTLRRNGLGDDDSRDGNTSNNGPDDADLEVLQTLMPRAGLEKPGVSEGCKGKAAAGASVPVSASPEALSAVNSSSSSSSSSSSPFPSSSTSSEQSLFVAAELLSHPNLVENKDAKPEARKEEQQAIQNLIISYIRAGDYPKAEKWLLEMRRRGLGPTVLGYAKLIHTALEHNPEHISGNLSEVARILIDRGLKAVGKSERQLDWWVVAMKEDGVDLVTLLQKLDFLISRRSGRGTQQPAIRKDS